jgi:undecaprenyl-diphosphatase
MADAAETAWREARARRRPLVIGGVIAAVLFGCFLALASALGTPAITAFDAALSAAVQSWRSPQLTAAMLRITDFGDTTIVLAICAALIGLALYRKNWREAGLVVVVVGAGRLLGSLAQNVVRRTRPSQDGAGIPLPKTFAFPSGHAITATLLYGLIGFLLWQALRKTWQRVLAVVACGVLIVAIGVSRIYLGVHWPSDVLAGWLLGGAWVSLVCGAYLSWGRGAFSAD